MASEGDDGEATSSQASRAPWSVDVDDVVAAQRTSLETGLTTAEATARLATYGRNELAKEEATPVWRLVLDQFDDVLVKVLLAAALVSFVLAMTDTNGDEGAEAFVEPAVIVLILVLNAVVGVWQESNAERALEALKEMQSEHAKTYRDGKLVARLPAAELVPGDVVAVSAGDRVPADVRCAVSKTATIRAQQASLTGESDAVAKRPDAISTPDAEIQAKEGMLFAGTAVASGSCLGVVTATGMGTEMGKIHGAISEAAKETDDTPLKKKLDQFGVLLTQLIGVICILVWLINYSHFVTIAYEPKFSVAFSFSKCTYYFKIAVALAVAAIPEGLPTVITTCLALGTRKMVKQNAIVRKLPSVETLGCTTVICSDKTGTLTTNQMSCVKCATASSDATGALTVLRLKGTSYDPSDGGVDALDVVSSSGVLEDPASTSSTKKKPRRSARLSAAAASDNKGAPQTTMASSSSSPLLASNRALDALATAAAICNEAELRVDESTRRVSAVGAPTEAALLPLVEKLAAYPNAVSVDDAAFPASATRERRDAFERLAILEFDRDRKSMSALARDTNTSDNNTALYCKGAPESVIERAAFVLLPDGAVAPATNDVKARWTEAAADMSSQALRCLAVAVKTDKLGPLHAFSKRGRSATGAVSAAAMAAVAKTTTTRKQKTSSSSTTDEEKDADAARKLLEDPSNYRAVESDLTLVGLCGLLDPPRPEVPGAIDACRAAGIRVVVITGDNKLTAEAICRDIGVLDDADDDDTGLLLDACSITGRDFAALSKSDQKAFLFGSPSPNNGFEEETPKAAAAVASSSSSSNGSTNNGQQQKKKKKTKTKTTNGAASRNGATNNASPTRKDLSGRVFSRAEPTHKQDIVRLLKEAGEVVAMTGDGVNDAPALKLADIGVAMGIAGTEVAKEASDMVLADDNFSSIVAAVAEGRSIYNNMKAFIRYMISSNVGEVASIFLTAALGMPEGLVPVQLLWVNLVTDGPPATALGFNPPDPDNMVKPPRRSDDALLTSWIVFRYFVVGAYVGVATVGVFAVWYTRESFLGIDLAADGHSTVTFDQLTHWGECETWSSEDFDANLSYGVAGGGRVSFESPCDYFGKGKVKASTLSLSVLVAIEMFNSLNALSEDVSLLVQRPWVNPYLLVAMALSFGLHFLIMYVPLLADTFAIVPLTLNEWLLVLLFSSMVVVIDELLKFVGRTFVTQKVGQGLSSPNKKITKATNGASSRHPSSVSSSKKDA